MRTVRVSQGLLQQYGPIILLVCVRVWWWEVFVGGLLNVQMYIRQTIQENI